MKLNYLFIFIALLLLSCASCKKQTTMNTNNADTETPNTPLPPNTDTITIVEEVSIAQKFNRLSLKEKIRLYNKMIVDSQVSILNFFMQKGMGVFLKKIATNNESWTKDIDKFINIQEYNSAIDDRPLFIGRIPLYGISEHNRETTDSEIQYVNFFPAKNSINIQSEVRFITFYAWQENDIDILEIRSINNSSFYIYFSFKNNQGATIEVQSILGLFQYTVTSPFVFDNTLFPTINEAIEKMIASIPESMSFS